MRLPLLLVNSPGYADRFRNERCVRENIWRREQRVENAALSNWRSAGDRRCRVVYYRDLYDVVDQSLYLMACYLLISWKLPKEELSIGVDEIGKCLADWEYNNGSFYQEDVNITIKSVEDYDGYGRLDLVFKSNNYPMIDNSYVWRDRFRVVPVSQTPKAISLSEVIDLSPCQIELGSGPSIECNIPSLRSLHSVYHLMDNGHFLFDISKDTLAKDLITDPSRKYKELSAIHAATFTTPPSEFYLNLSQFFACQFAVGDIFTNNFDGLCNSLGLKEHYLRKYDVPISYPSYTFDSRAKSLLVIGSHADRRQVQKAARLAKLPIIYVDPEQAEGQSYPIEFTDSNDYLIRLGAGEFSKNILDIL